MDENLEDVRCVCTVLRVGSMSKAAPLLGISTAAVSRRVERLEAALGQVLLHRTARGVRATPDGALLFERAGPLLAALEEAMDTVRAQDTALVGHLRMTAPRAVAAHFLTAWLVRFRRANPGLTIELSATDAWVDLSGQAVDLAVRVGPLPDSSDVALRLGVVNYMLAHGPAGDHGAAEALRDAGWAGLREVDAVCAVPAAVWRASSRRGPVEVRPRAVLSVDGSLLAAAAAAEGAGVAYLPTSVARRAGLTAVPLGPHGITPLSRVLYAVTPRGAVRRHKVDAVVQMLRDALAAEGAEYGITP